MQCLLPARRSTTPGPTSRLWARAVLIHPALAAAVIIVLLQLPSREVADAFVALSIGPAAASITATIVMVMRRSELPSHERWQLAITGAVATVLVCFIGFFVAVFIDLAYFCQFNDSCLE